jgi:tetratricopeptide (TPR) repeat protein
MLVVFASPGIVLISFGFVYIGLLFGVSSLLGKTETISVDYLKDPRTSFFMILSLVVLIMAGFSAIYFSANKFASIIFYNKALSSRDLESAEKNLNKAINLSSNDTYWKTRTMLYADQFKLLASKENPDKAQLQLVFTKAEQSAQSAIAINNQSSSSWLNLSQVYQLVGDTTNVEAIKNASDAGGEAQRLSPNNPLFAINNARIELIKKDTPLALSFIEKALEMKPDYLDAFIFKGQIGQSQGDQNSLKNELIKYVSISPYDEQGHVLLGNSYVNIKDYQSALNSFARAKQLNPNNSNTYLLYIGTLEISGEKNKAIEELEIFKVKFPNIQGVEDQIKRIKNIKSTDITTETPEIKN